MATDKGEPKLDRGTGVPTDSVEGETKLITDLAGAASPDFSVSSLGSPKSALSAARASANCSRITVQTSALILSPSCVKMVVSPIVGWDL